MSKPVEIRSTTPDKDTFPDLSRVQSVVLRDSQRVRKEAILNRIRSRNTGEHHHDALVIKTWKKTKNVCEEDPEHTVTLSNEEGDEIQTLLTFLSTMNTGAAVDGKEQYAVVRTKILPDPAALQSLLDAVSAEGQVDALVGVMRKAAESPDVFDAILERASRDPHLFAESAVALNLAIYKAAVSKLEELTEKPGVTENEFQQHLTKNPWMFGSEYSELLPRRAWTRDERQDFVLRRTTDGYIEMIEIKTPLDGAKLFNFDQSHESHYPTADLSKVVGQVIRYIEKIDASRNTIIADDKEDPLKIRAKIIVGRDGDADQVKALRSFNGHMNRIEIITFDHLLRIARRVISYLDSSIQKPEPPF